MIKGENMETQESVRISGSYHENYIGAESMNVLSQELYSKEP